MNTKPQTIEIELLALDLTSCTRCTGTLANIQKAIDTVRPVLEATGAQVTVKTLIVASEEQARQHRFVSSPTVRINGLDIAFETLESKCDSCTDLCGCDEGTSCRVWRYRGEEYTEAPVGLVVEELLKAVGTGGQTMPVTVEFDEVPKNLQNFFKGTSAAKPDVQTCCLPAEQATCCDSSQKDACCDDTKPEACGCR